MLMCMSYLLGQSTPMGIYVFARDPIVYKQRYEAAVNQILEQKGIVNGFSKLLNIVAPVDASTCTFPPSLFNFKG
uniref:Uncharacterized protein n=1 Tax=Ditylenchus dipsaci TaxID=166011 RepID=A0A915DUR4_9BILA